MDSWGPSRAAPACRATSATTIPTASIGSRRSRWPRRGPAMCSPGRWCAGSRSSGRWRSWRGSRGPGPRGRARGRGGEVVAGALVRRLEIQRSLEFVAEQLRALPKGELRAACGALRPGELVVALEEGWRGEVAHVAVTDDRGGIRRHKVTDPSFRNWNALALAMRGNQISDFPLCNKSFNLSYAGHDL